jgi:DNA modification methylase
MRDKTESIIAKTAQTFKKSGFPIINNKTSPTIVSMQTPSSQEIERSYGEPTKDQLPKQKPLKLCFRHIPSLSPPPNDVE